MKKEWKKPELEVLDVNRQCLEQMVISLMLLFRQTLLKEN